MKIEDSHMLDLQNPLFVELFGNLRCAPSSSARRRKSPCLHPEVTVAKVPSEEMEENCSRRGHLRMPDTLEAMSSPSSSPSPFLLNINQDQEQSMAMTDQTLTERRSGMKHERTGEEFFEPIRFVNGDSFPWPAPQLFSGL
jgi:hypothetical protein